MTLLVLVACGPVGPATVEGRLGQLDVTVVDLSGRLETVWFDTVSDFPDWTTDAVNPPERPDVVLIRWITARCGHSTVTLEAAEEGLHVRVRTPRTLQCVEDVGVQRSIRLVFDRRIDAAIVDVEESRDP